MTPTPTPPVPTRRARGWRTEPCPATLPVGIRYFDCQKSQTWKGRHPLVHLHRWDGMLDGQQAVITWRAKS